MVWKPHAPLPVEPTFDAFVRSVGGRLVSEMLPKSPDFENADYLFSEPKVIAELKQLDNDLRRTNAFKCKQIEFAGRHIRDGSMSFRTALGVDPVSPEFRRETL